MISFSPSDATLDRIEEKLGSKTTAEMLEAYASMGDAKIRMSLLTSKSHLPQKLRTTYHPKTTHHAKLYLTTSVVWANTQFATVWVLFQAFLVTRTCCTSGPILTIYTLYDVLPRKDVPFVCCADIAPHLGITLPYFGSVSRHFPAKRGKYSNFHIIKTTEWIASKF